MSRTPTDISGTQHGWLQAVDILNAVNRSGQKMWQFKCVAPKGKGVCGNKVILPAADVIRGNNKSCGCQRTAHLAKFRSRRVKCA